MVDGTRSASARCQLERGCWEQSQEAVKGGLRVRMTAARGGLPAVK